MIIALRLPEIFWTVFLWAYLWILYVRPVSDNARRQVQFPLKTSLFYLAHCVTSQGVYVGADCLLWRTLKNRCESSPRGNWFRLSQNRPSHFGTSLSGQDNLFRKSKESRRTMTFGTDSVTSLLQEHWCTKEILKCGTERHLVWFSS